jgi:squalene-hopene/tetraprenyl-beta-curcumene cyclase
MKNLWLVSAGLTVALMASHRSSTAAQEPGKYGKLTANSPDEALAKVWSAAKSAEFLDGVAMAWLQQKNCAACHTSYPYLMAGPSLSEKPTAGLVRMRKFFEDRVANWDSKDPAAQPEAGTEGITEVVATAATLAFHDAQMTGKLHPLTRKALERMWTLQRKDGAWDWNKHRLPPLEYDDYFGAVYAALGVGVAPDGYAQSAQAQEGLAKLLKYFQNNPPPDLHHKTWLMWASLKLDGLMTAAQRDQTIKDLLALQRDDGGWCLPALGPWKRSDGSANDPKAPSDGYATGLVLYVLRQAGVAAADKRIQRGVDWLTTHQRVSGRWFTRSVNADRGHYITHAGTAFAVMALKACETPKK